MPYKWGDARADFYCISSEILNGILKSEPESGDADALRLFRNANEAYNFVQIWGSTSEEVKSRLEEEVRSCPRCLRNYCNATIYKAKRAKKFPDFREMSFYEVIKSFDFLNFFRD